MQGKNNVTEYPEADRLTFDFSLLEYAAHLWRVAGTTLPPTMAEILHRDRTWDSEVATMKQAQDYWISQKEPKK